MIESFAALMALGFWFWVSAMVVFVAAIISVENEKFTITTPVVIIGIAGLIWLSRFDVWGWLSANAATVAIAVVVYLIVGVIYGALRYMFWVHKIADQLTEWANLNDYNVGALTSGEATHFKITAGLRNFPVRVADSKGRITFWMIYWPFSAPWTLINEPIKRFYAFAYGRIAGILQGITNNAFKGVNIIPD